MATYKPLQSVVLTAATSSVTFSGIDQGSLDLVLVMRAVGTSAGLDIRVQVNSDTGSNYSQFEDYLQPGISEGRIGQNTTGINLSRWGRQYLAQNTTNFWTFTVPEYARASTISRIGSTL